MAAVRLAVGGPPGRPRHAPGDRPQGPADLLEHGRLPGPVRARRRLGARRPPAPGARRPAGARPLGARPSAPARARGRPRRWRRFDTQRAGPAARGVRRRPVQLVRPPLAPPVLAGRPGGAAPPCTSAWTRHPADGAAHAVHHRAGLAGPVLRHVRTSARVGAPGRLAEVDGALIDPELSEQMALARRLVELGRAARADAR